MLAGIQEDSLFYTSAVVGSSMVYLFEHEESVIEKTARDLAKAGISRIIGMGGGASLSSMMAMEYALTRYSGVEVRALNAWEVLSQVGSLKGTAVVATSYSGQTPEVVEAARRAKAEGATVIAVTDTDQNPLAELADVVVPIRSKAVYTSPVTVAYLLSAHLMLARGESSDVARRLIADLHDFPAAANTLLPRVSDEARAAAGPLAGQYYVIAAGPQYGLGYKLGLSVIIENLWTNGSIIHAGEFYHGPIEIVEGERPHFICLLGADPSRTASENVVRFLERQGTPLLTFDSRAYGQYSDLMAPFPLFMATELWVMWMAAKAGHDVDERRYMGKVSKVWGEF